MCARALISDSWGAELLFYALEHHINNHRLSVEPDRHGGFHANHSEAIMTTNSQVDLAIKNLFDGGYQQARLHGVTRSLVKSMMNMVPGLGFSDDALTDDVKAELKKGYAVRWHEENPTRYFVAADGNWVECESEEKMLSHKKADKFTLDVHSAFAYTQQAFGALKSEQPLKHSLIGEVRDKFNKYCSNRYRDLKTAAKKIYNEENGVTQTRQQALNFNDYLFDNDKGILVTMRQRCITAKAQRNDESADVTKLDKALAAFKTAWNK
jgi:hypothetical protein